MKLKITDHLKKRLSERQIPLKIVKDIFTNPQEYYFDNLRKHKIVLNTVMYKGKLRKMLAAYDKIKNVKEVITTHPITDKEIKQRIETGRWSHEENQD